MSRKKNIKYKPSRAYGIGVLFCFGVAFLVIIYVSYANPIIRLEHFYFLFAMIGSLATALTLYLLMAQYNQAQLEKLETEKTSQAKKISAWIDVDYDKDKASSLKQKTPFEKIVISNKSDLPIFNIVLSIVDGRHSDADGRNTPDNFRRCIHTMPPGNGFIVAPNGYHGMGFVGAIEIGFEDSSNHYWVRHGNGSLEGIDEGTLKYYKVPLPPSYSIIQRME